jgi:hypothetical protein
MTVTPDHVTALRAALSGDAGAFEHMERQADLGHSQEFPAPMAAAFTVAVRSRFPGEWSVADVVKFVSQVRARRSDAYGDLSPSLAEQLVLATLRGTPVSSQFDETAKAYTQFMLLEDLVSSLDDQRLDMLLGKARDDADRWMAETARPLRASGG